jgi:TPR repeat protein
LAPLPVSALAHYLIGINYRLGDLGLEQDYTIALKHLTLSADAGYVPALRALGLMYAEGIGAPQDKAKANDLFQKAASQGDIRSLGLIAAHQASSNRESTASAMILYEKAAKAGSLAAQLALAELLQHTGQHTLAFQWFQTAASDSLNTEQENKISVLDLSIGFISQRNTARLMVARYLYNGWGGVIRNRIRAFKEFESLSKAGFSDAHYWLAACYEEGVKEEDDDTSSYVVESNLERAYDIYMQSAEAGDVDGQFQVAYMMSNGIAITKNLEDALVWYKRAAEQGHVIAQLSVGMYYEYGLVTPIDLEEAKKWYQLSASNNETTAMVRLAKILIELEDIQDACHWLRKAIDRGNVLAMRELADLYMDGLSDESVSVAEQYKLAYDYYRQAAEKNDALSLIALSKFYEGSYEEEEGETVVPVSFEMAVQCLTKAEKLGCST